MLAQLAKTVEYTDCFSSERVRPHSPNKCPGYDTKQSDGVVLVILEFWGLWSTPSLPLLQGPLWSGMVASDRVLSLGQRELNGILLLN